MTDTPANKTDQQKITLKEATNALSIAVSSAFKHFEAIDKNNISQLVESYRYLQATTTLINDLVKTLNGLEDNLSSEIIPSALENLQLDSIKSKGYLYSLGVRTFASIPLDKQEKGQAWLKEVGAEALIKPTVNAKTLSSFVKSYIEEHGKKPPEDAVSLHQKKYISVRKAT